MNPMCLSEPSPTQLHKALSSSTAPANLHVFGYRRRLFLYTGVLYVTMLLELAGVLISYSDTNREKTLTVQLIILLILLSGTALLFTLSLLFQSYWVKLIAQSLSFLLTSTGYFLLDSHFLPRIIDSNSHDVLINGLIPTTVLAVLLPPVLMFNWCAYGAVLVLLFPILLAIRACGVSWEIGLLESGMLLVWFFPFLSLIYTDNLRVKSLFSLQIPDINAEFSPPKRSKTANFSSHQSAVGTELEDILSQLDKLHVLIHSTVVPGGHEQKQWAENTLLDVMERLANGRNIYQGTIHNSGVDPDDLVYLEQNYLQKNVESGVMHMSSLPDSRVSTTSDISLLYSVSELIPVLQKIGNNWNFDVFFVSQCTENHALQTCSEYIFKRFHFAKILKVPENSFRSFFDSLASVSS